MKPLPGGFGTLKKKGIIKEGHDCPCSTARRWKRPDPISTCSSSRCARVQMESINDCFLLEKELRGVVQKGMRGNVGAVEYLEEVRGKCWRYVPLMSRNDRSVIFCLIFVFSDHFGRICPSRQRLVGIFEGPLNG